MNNLHSIDPISLIINVGSLMKLIFMKSKNFCNFYYYLDNVQLVRKASEKILFYIN